MNHQFPRFLKHSRSYEHNRRRHQHSHPHRDQRSFLKPRHRHEQYFAPFRSPFDLSPKHNTAALTMTGPLETRSGIQSRVMKEMLKLHNFHRARHCAPPLVLSNRLNETAQSYAEHLAATSTFEHSHMDLDGKHLGENLYMSWISAGPVKVDAKAAVKSWYDEISMHNFNKPKFSKETGHFTQLVWKASKKLGVGVALSPNGREVYMVAHYFPGGNIMGPGYFEHNVLPPNC